MKNQVQKICVIGVGVMGSIIAQNLDKKAHLYLVDKDQSKLAGFKHAIKTDDILEAVRNSQIVIIAVKPQSFNEVAKKLANECANKLLISIMAGISLQQIATKTGAKKVIRAMPNIALSINHGITGLVASKAAKSDMPIANMIFNDMGTTISFKTEKELDALTPISGSGPAYFYFLAEELAKAGKKLGFSKEEAERIARQTLIGAARLLESSTQTPAELRKAVSSKKGVTETAIKSLSNAGWGEIFFDAVKKARTRTKALNKLLNK